MPSWLKSVLYFSLIQSRPIMKTKLSFLLFWVTFTAQSQIRKVTVRHVYDAQVLNVFSDEYEEEFIMILVGIACPGLNQPYGKEAKEFVAKAIQGKTVRVTPVGQGPDGELLGVIYTPGGKNLNERLVGRGLAQADERETEWLKLQEKARNKKAGIWKDGQSVDLEKDWTKHHFRDRVKPVQKTE